MRVTMAQLMRLDACKEQRSLAAIHWGESVEVTPETCAEAAALGLNVEWAAKRLLTDEQYKKYRAIEQSAWKKYNATRRSALKKYRVIEQPALKKYRAIQQPAWEKYNAACWQAFAEVVREDT